MHELAQRLYLADPDCAANVNRWPLAVVLVALVSAIVALVWISTRRF